MRKTTLISKISLLLIAFFGIAVITFVVAMMGCDMLTFNNALACESNLLMWSFSEFDSTTLLLICIYCGIALLALICSIFVLIARRPKTEKTEEKSEATETVVESVEAESDATEFVEPEVVTEETKSGSPLVVVEEPAVASPVVVATELSSIETTEYDAKHDEVFLANIRSLNLLADECRDVNAQLQTLVDKYQNIVAKVETYRKNMTAIDDPELLRKVIVAINQLHKLSKRLATKIKLTRGKRRKMLDRLTEKRVVVSNYILANHIKLSTIRDIERDIMVEISLNRKLEQIGEPLVLSKSSIVNDNIVDLKNDIVELQQDAEYWSNAMHSDDADKLEALDNAMEIEEKLDNARDTLAALLCGVDESQLSSNIEEIAKKVKDEIEQGSGVAARDVIFQSLKRK